MNDDKWLFWAEAQVDFALFAAVDSSFDARVNSSFDARTQQAWDQVRVLKCVISDCSASEDTQWDKFEQKQDKFEQR